MNERFDDEIKPWTPVLENPIRTADFLRYVGNHQIAMEKYKDEFQVRNY